MKVLFSTERLPARSREMSTAGAGRGTVSAGMEGVAPAVIPDEERPSGYRASLFAVDV